jgi:hypothetical protein
VRVCVGRQRWIAWVPVCTRQAPESKPELALPPHREHAIGALTAEGRAALANCVAVAHQRHIAARLARLTTMGGPRVWRLEGKELHISFEHRHCHTEAGPALHGA